MPSSYDVFISSQRSDREWVEHFVKALAKEGISAWDDTQIKPGDMWAEEIQNAIATSRYVLFVITNKQVITTWRALELGLVLGAGKPVIPIIPMNVPPDKIPGPLRVRQSLQKSDPEIMAKEIKRVVQT